MRHTYFIATFIAIVLLTTHVEMVLAFDSGDLKSFMKNQPDRVDWGIGFAEVNGHTYLIAVESSPINGASPKAKIKAMKEAEMLAQEQLVKFIHGIQSDMVKDVSSTIKIISNKHGTSVEEVNRLSEIIKESSGGVLKNISSFYRWVSDDKYEYFVAVGVGIKEKDKYYPK